MERVLLASVLRLTWETLAYLPVVFAYGLLIFFALAVGVSLAIEVTARLAVKNTPKVPMRDCDTHGPSPESAWFYTTATVLGKPDVKVWHCPFCWDDKQKALTKQVDK